VKKISNFTESERNDSAEAYVRELLRGAEKWETEEDIANAINERYGEKFHQSTIHRALRNKLKAKKIGKFWTLEPEIERMEKLSALKEFMAESVDDDTRLIKNPDIYILKTKNSHNTLLAKKIQALFSNEIRSIVCPNMRDIIIFYGGEPCGQNSGVNAFEETILENLERTD
jgi:arginine repressor